MRGAIASAGAAARESAAIRLRPPASLADKYTFGQEDRELVAPVLLYTLDILVRADAQADEGLDVGRFDFAMTLHRAALPHFTSAGQTKAGPTETIARS